MVPVLILAAGLGTRIRPVSGNLPKPLIAFGGTSILAHNLRLLAAAGVREVWINLHYRAALIAESIGDGAAFGLLVHYLYEPELLGTAGAFANMQAQPSVPRGTTLVVYGDNLLRLNIARLLDVHRTRAADCTIALFDRATHCHTGIAGGRVELASDGRVTAFVEGAAVSPDGSPAPLWGDLINTGVYAIEPSVSSLLPSGRGDFGRDVFPSMLRSGQKLLGHVLEPGAYCLGLDTPESYAAAQALLQAGRIALA